MKTFYDKYKQNFYSQNGEDGIIDECLKRFDPIIEGKCCEIGAHDGVFCSNTYNLRKRGWYGLLIEGDPAKWDSLMKNTTKNSNTTQQYATEKNVNNILGFFHYNVLSIDIDGNDYNVWKAYTGKPDIVIIEINSSINPKSFGPVSDPNLGTSYHAMVDLGIKKGYFLLCHTGNLIFVLNKHRDKFPEIVGDGILNHEEYFKTDWL